ncbi:glycosyltransferase family 1 protein [bacterium]|nr:MAG: glycosyltransferase family 1 protein [bacterium]
MENQGIKSTIAVHTKYHAFRLAEGLYKMGILDKVYTLTPRFKLKSYDLPGKAIKSFWILGGLKFLNLRLGRIISDNYLTDFFDDLVSFFLKKPAEKWIFTGYSGFCEKSLKKAKKMGAITCVERACPHIDEQSEFVRKEKSALLKKEEPIVPNPTWERMKREYDIADYIIVPSNYSRKSFLSRGFAPSKVVITPLCNEKKIVPREGEKKYPERFTVLCVGGNFYRKGIFYLLEAWRMLGLKNAKLIIKGGVPGEFSELLKTPGLEIVDSHLSEEELGNLYNDSTLVVLPSIDDGFGMVVVEAMSIGLPVIITENVGSADIIRNGEEGFIVPIRNPKALAEKIKFFYDSPDKVREMGGKARETAKNYTPERYAERVAAAYEKMLAEKAGK